MYVMWWVLAGNVRVGELRNVACLNIFHVNSDRVSRACNILSVGKGL